MFKSILTIALSSCLLACFPSNHEKKDTRSKDLDRDVIDELSQDLPKNHPQETEEKSGAQGAFPVATMKSELGMVAPKPDPDAGNAIATFSVTMEQIMPWADQSFGKTPRQESEQTLEIRNMYLSGACRANGRFLYRLTTSGNPDPRAGAYEDIFCSHQEAFEQICEVQTVSQKTPFGMANGTKTVCNHLESDTSAHAELTVSKNAQTMFPKNQSIITQTEAMMLFVGDIGEGRIPVVETFRTCTVSLPDGVTASEVQPCSEDEQKRAWIREKSRTLTSWKLEMKKLASAKGAPPADFQLRESNVGRNATSYTKCEIITMATGYCHEDGKAMRYALAFALHRSSRGDDGTQFETLSMQIPLSSDDRVHPFSVRTTQTRFDENNGIAEKQVLRSSFEGLPNCVFETSVDEQTETLHLIGTCGTSEQESLQPTEKIEFICRIQSKLNQMIHDPTFRKREACE